MRVVFSCFTLYFRQVCQKHIDLPQNYHCLPHHHHLHFIFSFRSTDDRPTCFDNVVFLHFQNAYGPLLEIVPHRIFQSQVDLYLDSKGTELPHQACTPRPRHLNHSRTNLQHLPCHQVSPSSRSEVAADSRPFSQKHLHDLFPVSVRRSMDGEGADWDKRRRGSPNRHENRATGPPPNRTILS